MSAEYDEYIKNHKDCVVKAFEWIMARIPSQKLDILFPNLNEEQLCIIIGSHDQSKYSPAEYGPYNDYFYGEKTDSVKKAFDYAWLHHIHNNPHHWQYWILKEDDTIANEHLMYIKPLEIPDVFIIEMICDWWSFSWKNYLISHDKNDLYEIFNWYTDHAGNIAMNQFSLEKVHSLLRLIKETLDDSTNLIEVV